MQDNEKKPAARKMKGKTKAAIACGLAAWALFTWAYIALINTLIPELHMNISSPRSTDYIASIGAENKEVNISELFRTHLKNRYGGTYYDGEFVVGKIEVSRSMYSTGYSAYAYRADMPELKFFMRSTGAEISTEDHFLETLIAWEGNKAMGDVITDIYSEDILYQVSVSFDDNGDETSLQRNGYHGLVEHYKEDGSFPYVEIVVFTNEFFKDEAVGHIVELYNVIACGNGVDSFSCSILYTQSDDSSRGASYDSQSIIFPYMGSDEDSNLFATLFLYSIPIKGMTGLEIIRISKSIL